MTYQNHPNVSWMVSKPVFTVVDPTLTDAGPICQKPVLASTGINSISPVKRDESVPPRNNEEPSLANLKANSPFGTAPFSMALLKNGLRFRAERRGYPIPKTLFGKLSSYSDVGKRFTNLPIDGLDCKTGRNRRGRGKELILDSDTRDTNCFG